jgi:K+-transporting ATPase ATPase A chain
MTIVGWVQIALVLALVLAAAVPMSGLIDSIYAGRANFLSPVLRPVEFVLYKIAGVDEKREQTWLGYAMAMLVFSVAGFVSLYAVQRLQNVLPFNPMGFDAVPPDLAFNTSTSFITNTNWQNYGGETTMSNLTQMLGLTVHNFLSAATGLAMAFALVRAFARSSTTTVGNFWVDMTRVVLYVLLPLSVVIALVMCALGVPQTLAGSIDATTLEGVKQTISLGPVASQEAIKELGTNGGGFFIASVLAFGRSIGDTKQGRAILTAMAVLLVAGVAVIYWSEAAGNPELTALNVSPAQGNMEGHEVRFGQALTALFIAGTSGTSTGAVNGMIDSFTPLAGLVPMFNLLAGCIWPGGVGSGLYGFLVVAIVAVFVAGLMVGRTPEYLGKKIEAREMKLAMLAVLIYPLVVLGFSAASVMLKVALDSLGNNGAHGLSEIIYAYASTNANNGSAFAGLNGNIPWFNTTLGLAMLLGRFCYVIPVLALAGSLGAKKKVAASVGTFPTDGPLFVGLLLGVIVILYLLQYFPALALGPVVEHFQMLSGKAF